MISKNFCKNIRKLSSLQKINFNNKHKDKCIHKSYEFQHLIGKGGFGSVYQGYTKNNINNKVAIKRIDKHINKNEISELDILNYLSDFRDNTDSQFIINYLESFDSNGKIYIISELYTGGDLYDKLVNLKGKNISEYWICIKMKQIFRGLLYLHKNNIIHRDIKPENIVFKNKNSDSGIVIIDLGMSTRFINHIPEENLVNDRIMSYSFYISPESLNGYYNASSDIWSAGVIMYMLLSGEHPFYNKSIYVTRENIKKGKYNIESNKWDKISANSKDLLKSILEVNPEKRIDIDSILNHNWFNEFKGCDNFK